MTHDELIDWLTAQQRDLAERDVAFAQRIGVSRQMWQALRSGVARIGPRSGRGIVAAFPHLHDDVAALFLPTRDKLLT